MYSFIGVKSKKYHFYLIIYNISVYVVLGKVDTFKKADCPSVHNSEAGLPEGVAHTADSDLDGNPIYILV